MAIQYVDKHCEAVGHVAATYTINGTNDQLSFKVDGGSTQTFTLTHGAAQTAANVVSDLNGANGNTPISGATATDVLVGSSHYLRIRTSTANGATSTVQILAPSNNANSILGFNAFTYTGGQNINAFLVGGVKQTFINSLETALQSAGWITISGSGTTNLLMQSSMSPDPQNLRGRVRIKENSSSNSCITISIENVDGSKAGSSATNAGAQILWNQPAYRLIANKHQAFLFLPNSYAGRTFAAWGVPALPSNLQNGTVYEAIWLNSNASSDGDGTVRGSFRVTLGAWGGYGGANNGSGNTQMICNNNAWEVSGANGTTFSGGSGTFSLLTISSGIAQNTSATWMRYTDLNYPMGDPILAWGLTVRTDEAMGRGLLWDAFTVSDAFPADITMSSIDSHNWWQMIDFMYGNTNSNTWRGSLWLVVP